MTTESAGIRLENFPASGAEAILRPVGFNIGDKINVLIEIGDADGDDLDIAITVGGGPDNSDLADFLKDLVELMGLVADSAGAEIERAIGGES